MVAKLQDPVIIDCLMVAHAAYMQVCANSLNRAAANVNTMFHDSAMYDCLLGSLPCTFGHEMRYPSGSGSLQRLLPNSWYEASRSSVSVPAAAWDNRKVSTIMHFRSSSFVRVPFGRGFPTCPLFHAQVSQHCVSQQVMATLPVSRTRWNDLQPPFAFCSLQAVLETEVSSCRYSSLIT